jgi:hypothetical protein
MPGFLLTTAASVICTHGASVSIVSGNSRVKAGGAFVAVLSDTGTVSGCPFQVPIGAGTKPQPCVTVRFLVPATRVRIGGQPAILQTSSGICQSAEQIPQGPPTVVSTQTRVKGT